MEKLLGLVLVMILCGIAMALSACQTAPALAVQSSLPTETESSLLATTAPAATSVPSATVPPAVKVIWTFQTKGPVWGTPTIIGNLVYFGSDDNNLYAVDTSSSQLRWKFTTKGVIRSHPAEANGLIFFSSDDGYLYAVNAQTGKQVWQTDIGNAEPRDQRDALGSSPSPLGFDYLQSSPIADQANQLVYVGSKDGKVYALAEDRGTIQWTYQTGDKVRATPALADGMVYVGSWDKNMYALEARTGKLVWSTPLNGQVQTTALVEDGLVYTASRKASVVALDAQTGEMKWEYPYGQNMWVESSPRLLNGILYIGSSGSNMVVGLNHLTGEPYTLYATHAFMWSTPLVGEDRLYIGGATFQDTDYSGLYRIKLVKGKFTHLTEYQWLMPVKSTMEASGNWSGVASSPIVANGVIYFSGLDGVVYAIQG